MAKTAPKGAKRGPGKPLSTLSRAQRRDLVTQHAYAEQRKCAPSLVNRRAIAGSIDVFGPKRLICPALADAQWSERVRARADSAPANASNVGGKPEVGQDPQDSYAELRRRRERAELARAEMETERMAGSLIERSVAKKVVGDYTGAVRDRLMAVPRRAAPACVGLEVREIEAIIAGEIRRALTMDIDDILASLVARSKAA